VICKIWRFLFPVGWVVPSGLCGIARPHHYAGNGPGVHQEPLSVFGWSIWPNNAKIATWANLVRFRENCRNRVFSVYLGGENADNYDDLI